LLYQLKFFENIPVWGLPNGESHMRSSDEMLAAWQMALDDMKATT
jgi:hypothetical protein